MDNLGLLDQGRPCNYMLRSPAEASGLRLAGLARIHCRFWFTAAFSRICPKVPSCRYIVAEILAADAKEIGGSLDAADVMQKPVGRLNAFTDEIHEFFHALDLGVLSGGGGHLAFPELSDKEEQVTWGR